MFFLAGEEEFGLCSGDGCESSVQVYLVLVVSCIVFYITEFGVKYL